MNPTHALEQMLAARAGQVAREFEDLESFALHLVTMEAIWKAQRRRALNEAAKLIKEDAREQIGTYQPAVGAYPQWAPLADSTEDQKARVGAPPNAPLLRFGELANSFQSALVSDEEVVVGSTDPVMEYHEFGTYKMPPRPVLGPALLKNIDAIQALLGGALLDTVVSGQRMAYRFTEEAWGSELKGNEDWHFSAAETGEPFK